MLSVMRFVQKWSSLKVSFDHFLSIDPCMSTPHNVPVQMYKEVQHALQAAGKEASVVVTVITGAGEYYCSANNLSNLSSSFLHSLASSVSDCRAYITPRFFSWFNSASVNLSWICIYCAPYKANATIDLDCCFVLLVFALSQQDTC